MPAYVVFADRTLLELASNRPASAGAMREIHGVGEAKLERYGAAFLDVIRGQRLALGEVIRPTVQGFSNGVPAFRIR